MEVEALSSHFSPPIGDPKEMLEASEVALPHGFSGGGPLETRTPDPLIKSHETSCPAKPARAVNPFTFAPDPLGWVYPCSIGKLSGKLTE